MRLNESKEVIDKFLYEIENPKGSKKVFVNKNNPYQGRKKILPPLRIYDKVSWHFTEELAKKAIAARHIRENAIQEFLTEDDNSILYHASPTQNLKIIMPKIGSSHDKQKIERIYASYNPTFASAFTFRWDDSIASLGRVNGGPYILRITESCLDGRMNRPCSMYEVDPTNFTESGHSISEFISLKPVRVLKEHKFNSAIEAMKHFNLKVIRR